MFENYLHPNASLFHAFVSNNIGAPSAILPCLCDKAGVIARMKKKLEIEEVGEEQQEELDQ